MNRFIQPRIARGPGTGAAILLLLLLGLTGTARSRTAEADTTGRVIQPELALEKVAAAREAASKDQHRTATALYLEALGYDATLVPLVAQEMAYQKLWREDAERSIFYFRRYLARHPDSRSRDIRKGLALAYSWSGRQDKAAALYRELVEEDPTDGGSRGGLGRSLVWDNRLHEGFTVLRGVETEFPPESAPGLESSDFLLTVLSGYEPHLKVDVTASWDSDDLDIYRITPTGTFTILGNKLLQVMPSYGIYRRPGQSTIGNPRLGTGFITALAHNWALHAYGWIQHFGSSEPLLGSTTKLDWTRPGGDLWFTWLVTPRIRTDFGAASQVVETFAALNDHIHFEQANLSADWRFARHFTLGAGGSLADYSDGNERSRSYVRVTWRREGRWEILAGPQFNYMDFLVPYPGQYWSPDWVRQGGIFATVKTRTRNWTFDLDGSVGQEKEIGTNAFTVGAGSFRAGWRFEPAWLLAGRIGYSKSSFSSASGYSRTSASLTVRAMF